MEVKGGLQKTAYVKIKTVCVFIKLTQKWTKHHHFKIGPRKKLPLQRPLNCYL